MAVVRWNFYDGVLSTTYTFPINPNAGGSPAYRKRITEETTSAPAAKTLLFEGNDEVQQIEFSGTILDQAHYDTFVTWFKKRRQIRITDDLGRQFWVYIKEFVPTRVRSAGAPYKHTYTCTAVILSGA